MEGITVEVIEKIEKMAIAANSKENAVIKVDGKDYWEKTKQLIIDDPRHEKISVNSLSAIVTYVADNREGFEPQNLIAHVFSPFEVRLLEKAGKRNKRTPLMGAGLDNDVEMFHFGMFMDVEQFVIGVMSRFEDLGERTEIIAIASSLRSEKSLENTDTGATTKYEAKHGVFSLSGVKIPDVVLLYPFRTFRQVEQPGSTFIFRYRANEDGHITIGLFEADGGAWKHVAMASIEKYLKDALPEVQVIA